MEDLEFYKKWCLAHLKFDKEKALKDDFRNQSSKDRVIKDLNKIEDIVLTYYNNKNIRKLKFFFLTSSLRTPKIFIKEFGDFLMSCHQHCLGVNLLVQR